MLQREQIPLLRQSELSFWQWSATPRCRRRVKQNLTKFWMEDFPNISIFLPFPTSRQLLKKFIGMHLLWYPLLCLNCVSRWNPVFPIGRHLFLSNKVQWVTSWHPYLFKASRTNPPAMISTTTIIFPPNLLRFPTNGDFRLLLLNHFENFLVSQILLPRAMLNDERVYPEPQEFRPERFLKNGVLDNSVRDPMDIAFGFGRRCAFFSLSCLIL